jgi:hypothetical protein
MFPLPTQTSWNVFQLNCKMVTRVIFALRMTPFTLDDWRKLPKVGRHAGVIGVLMSNLWEWIHTLTTYPSKPECDALLGLHNKHRILRTTMTGPK